jgi:MinD superfamily P-loop ATPase
MINVSKNKCIGCGLCQEQCPTESIIIQDSIAKIDKEQCIECEECIKSCPQNAIKNINQELVFAIGTDDGQKIKTGDHFGMSKYFQVWNYSEGELNFQESRENAKYKEDETKTHGDPGKAKATASVLNGIDVLVGSRIGPNITRLNDKFVCAVVREISIEKAKQIIAENINEIIEEKDKNNRTGLVLN